jgi:hypothetical protein
VPGDPHEDDARRLVVFPRSEPPRGSLLGQKKFAEAEPLLLRGYEGMKAREKTIPSLDKVRLREAAERVIRLYEEWGKFDQAAVWKTKLVMPDLPADVFATP